MSELKDHRFCECDEIVREYRGQLSNEMRPYYLKSEADKVIAEKDAEIVELKKQVHDYALGLFVIQASAEKEARHQKHRRCLAMAKWCDSEMNYWYDRIEMEQCQRFKFYDKWHKRWLELAEKFKEADDA
jgi:hypothetical protein